MAENLEKIVKKITKLKRGLNKTLKTALAGLVLSTGGLYAQGIGDAVVNPKYNLVAQAEAGNSEKAELNFDENDAAILGGNVLINSLIGGFGAKKHHKSFVNGFLEGALGGSIVYSGKKLMGFGIENPHNIGYGKLVSDLGTSITYSAASGENWLKNPRFMTDIGPFVLDFEKEKGLKPNFYILSESAAVLMYYIGSYGFDTDLSSKSLVPVFSDKSWGDGGGFTSTNIVRANKKFISTMAHEAIHTRQYFNFISLDPIIEEQLNNKKYDNVKLSRLRYDNHPFRFGAGFGCAVTSGIGYGTEQWEANTLERAE